MDKKLIFALFILIGVGTYFVVGATILQSGEVISCNETDAGLDYLNFGTNWAVLNDTNQTLVSASDFCFDNWTIGEYACGSSIGPQYANLAALVSENCSVVPINGTMNAATCSLGRCI